MATETVTDATFETDVLQSSEPVVVDFWAEWCGPCKAIAPSLEQISEEMAGQVKVVKLNVEDNHQTATKYQITSIPTLIMFKDGQKVSNFSGAGPKAKLEAWIQGAL